MLISVSFNFNLILFSINYPPNRCISFFLSFWGEEKVSVSSLLSSLKQREGKKTPYTWEKEFSSCFSNSKFQNPTLCHSILLHIQEIITFPFWGPNTMPGTVNSWTQSQGEKQYLQCWVLGSSGYSTLNLSSYFIVKSDSNSRVQCLKNVKIQVFLCPLSRLISIE